MSKLDKTMVEEQPMKRPPGNPNFTEGNRIGAIYPPVVEGEKTIAVGARLPISLKARFDALPGTPSQKIRRAVELLLQSEDSD